MDLNWLIAISNCMIAGGVVLAWKELKADHSRSRKQKAIEYGANWVRAQNIRMTTAAKIGSKLSNEAELLRKGESITIPAKYVQLVMVVFPELVDTGQDIKLTPSDTVSIVRLATCIHYGDQEIAQYSIGQSLSP